MDGKLKHLRRLAALILIIFVWVCAAAITYHTSTVNTTLQTSPATASITVSAGDLIVACFTAVTNGSITGFADGQGSYTAGPTATDMGGNQRVTWLYYLPNANSGSHTVSVSFSGSATNTGIFLIALTGAATSTPLDTSGTNTGGGGIAMGDNPIGVLSTQAQTAEAFVACATTNGADTWSVGSNFTAALSGGATGFGMEYKIVSTDLHPFTGQFANDAAAGAGSSYSGVIASFKAAAGGSAVPRINWVIR